MVQAVAIVIAVMLTLPDYLDRLLRPTLCTQCLDLRGLAFVLSVIFLMLALFRPPQINLPRPRSIAPRT